MAAKKAFTLAEIMISLSVIAILTAILLPAAFHATPNELILKFKKAHATLATVIRELATSEKYYLEGDLGKKPNDTLINDSKYLCNTIADILSVKSVNCSNSAAINQEDKQIVQVGTLSGVSYGTLEEAKNQVDVACSNSASTIGAEIVLTDDTIFYQTSPVTHFGITEQAHAAQNGAAATTSQTRIFGSYLDDNGLDRVYKIYCIDIDGINNGEAPFGYGIRVDGRILSGARADEWMTKGIQEKD